jgi:ABC-type bacteriocin/lantibiotic exporter with double-glycine peptidase domain
MLRFSSPTIANIEQQLNETHDLVDILSNKNAVETHYQFYKSIEIQNISYRYPDSDQLSLNNISLSIKKGESVGIIGKSGAGKSTLMDVILGLIPPSSGSIFVDGKSIHDDVSSWYRLVGYVQQDIFLIDASIRENIAFGIHEHDVDHERLSKAVRESQLDSFISSLSNGLDTQLGERGVRLSGGQKQRIGIARALYREASVLVLDEATSAIDNETEIELLSVIKNFKGKKTTIVIAHRLSTLVHCDWIVKLGNGAVENIIQGADMVNKFRE